MSTGIVLAIVIGGTVLLLGAVAAFVIWIKRSFVGRAEVSVDALREEAARRGWTFVERDDSMVALYDRQYDRRSWWEPLTQPPRAKGARDVITGTHRGRPFVAATFDTVYQGQHQPERAIWVAAPAPHPMLSIHRVAGTQNALNRSIGLGGVQTGNVEFDRRFEVLSEDERFAHAVLSPQLQEFLLTDPRSFRGVYLRGEYLDVLDPVQDHRNPDELVAALDLRCDILDRIPAWS
ncbi:DUF3137 domain-containing protein [Saccharomonospora viridis]|jgi:hypothetical protein|uniref:DUF3137 domain-containing protein n=1 Tax=Saccharomonospora viridis (strain ATCC 15386 / DSM 43017 / JCM 3036 / CCUG 5913 / NBRC 12207 / NCIMB 9602 / P101) TaxID=471857 RepID=C7MW17_SACVD|nr:DUF3137 domain-containing protein [Saccharomonospora viridis]ACU97117.1 hypothetical protein Svir_21040 [Saccharomonospora viridis DSM 43017]